MPGKRPPNAADAAVRWGGVAALFLVLAGVLWQMTGRAADAPAAIPPAAFDPATTGVPGPQSIVLAGGCFWGVQLVFQHVKGVRSAVSGYAGGSKETASYEIVGSGMTGHAESVEVTFDPSEISLGRILQIYFSVAHDPTELNRQGPDVGPQYRSAIFYQGETQKKIAETYIAQLDREGVFGRPIVTQVKPLAGFYPAEAYHQNYATLHPQSPYIAFNDLPKAANLHRLFGELYRDDPVLVAAANQTN
jgi:peptide-methionine (S)-S-oxide reductase